VAFKQRKDFNPIKHAIIPGLGFLANLVMVGGILYLYIIGNADAVSEAHICFWIAGGWGLVSLLYVGITTVHKTYKVKMITCVIRPEQLGEVANALKNQELMMGMTVMDVRGFGRQKGESNGVSKTRSNSSRSSSSRFWCAIGTWNARWTSSPIRCALGTSVTARSSSTKRPARCGSEQVNAELRPINLKEIIHV